MKKQTANTVLMVTPYNFGFNDEAYLSNKFQQKPTIPNSEILTKAIFEFHDSVNRLKVLGIKVIVHDDKSIKNTPDAIFPNNWISTHQAGILNTYPMAVSNRRAERNDSIINQLISTYNYQHKDYSGFENNHLYLEGTGSLIFDHINNKVYASISPRTNENLVKIIAKDLGYTPICFTAYGKENELIYHTNVMLAIGDKFAIIGSETIDKKDKNRIVQELKNSNKELIQLTNQQVYNSFAGNMLQLENESGEKVLVLSKTAFQSMNDDQINTLKKYNPHFCIFDIPSIEKIGGGSARCMLAEIFD